MNVYFARQNFPARFELFIGFLLTLFLIFLVWWNLDGYPITSGWDEGIYLQLSQNLSHLGIYATRDGNQFDELMPNGGTGPILISSVALGIQLFGDTLFAARSIIAIYLIFSIIGLYLLIREISRWEVAVLSVFIYLAAGYGYYDTLWFGRQVLAEIPAFAFLFFGLWGLIKVIKHNSIPMLLTSSIFLGLAVVTKNQLLWILAPALTVMIIYDKFFLREHHWKLYLVATGTILISFMAWYFASLFMVGSEKAFYQQAQTALLIASYLRVSFSRILENSKLLFSSGFLIPIALAGLYNIIILFKKNGVQKQVCALFLVVAGFELFSTIVMGLPWARYIYTSIVLMIPIFALLMGDTISWLNSHPHTLAWIATAIALFVFLGFIGYKMITDTILIVRTKNQDAQQFAQLVDRTVPAGNEVLNWEWEVEYFSRSNYIHPDFRLFPALIDQIYSHIDSPVLQNQRIPQGIHYLIVGPFAEQTNVFNAEEKQHMITPLGQVGAYSLLYVQ